MHTMAYVLQRYGRASSQTIQVQSMSINKLEHIFVRWGSCAAVWQCQFRYARALLRAHMRQLAHATVRPINRTPVRLAPAQSLEAVASAPARPRNSRPEVTRLEESRGCSLPITRYRYWVIAWV